MRFLSFAFNLFLFCFSFVQAQQPYIGQGTNKCSTTSNSALGYSCNGINNTCQSYLTFRAQPPYTTVTSISTLLGSNPSQLAAINSVPQTATFPTNQLVLVPVTCSCSGPYYQTNTSFVVRTGDNFFFIANQTLQGLSTCQAIRNANRRSTTNIFPGQTLNVPLRCACPTRNQTDQGISYLLSYLVTWGDFVSSASVRFGGDTGWSLEANGLTEKSATIFPFTTLLVPLQKPPSSNHTITQPPPPPPAKSQPLPTSPAVPGSSSSKTWVYAVAGVVGGMMVTLLVVGIGLCLCFRARKVKLDPVATSESFETVDKATEKVENEPQGSFLERLSSIAHSIQVYTFEEVVAATDNFSSKCWIKGSVYQANINGDPAAVKKMDGDVSKEINLLNKINHSNIIRLCGVCFNDGYWYLVYEFAANGALSDWMYSSSTNKALSWHQRIQIALDIANGLHYLHNFTEPPYVHKDISSSNILLDADLRAKIANFSLARSAEAVLYPSSSIRLAKGTKGYLAPEYLEYGLVIPEIDVYAFGVVLTELITRKEAVFWQDEREVLLSEAIMKIVDGEDSESELCNFIDPSLHPKQKMSFVLRMVRLVLMCLAKEPEDRPSMGEIVSSLSKIQLEVYRSDFMQCSSS
ncbi:LysM domain receptor-like kinase 4 [Linum grandiflorum]